MKSPDFPYDVYRFLISGLRDNDRAGVLERFMGASQEQFERTHSRIQQIKWLSDPVFCPDDLLDYLLALVGWDGTAGQEFIENLDANQKRKLIKISAELWKKKGTAGSLIDSIRIFTGKTAQLDDYFFHRLLIDESAIQYTTLGGTSWITGGLYTEKDEYLFVMLINRQGLEESDRRLIYDLISYILPALEHTIVVYASFLDNFDSGELQRWVEVGTPGAAIGLPSFQMQLDPLASVQPNISDEELATWEDSFSWVMGLQFGDTATPNTEGIEIMWNAEPFGRYRVRLYADGNLEFATEVGAAPGFVTKQTATVPIPAFINPGTIDLTHYFSITFRVEAISAAEVRVRVLFNGHEAISFDEIGWSALYKATAPCTLSRLGVDAGFACRVDNVIAYAPPFRIQPIGQQRLPANGIASPDPGPEPFIPDSANTTLDFLSGDFWMDPPVPVSTVLYDSVETGFDLAEWTIPPITDVVSTEWYNPFGNGPALWWGQTGSGSGFGRRIKDFGFLFGDTWNPGDPIGPDWTEDPVAPGVARGNLAGTTSGWVLSGGIPGFPSPNPRVLEYVGPPISNVGKPWIIVGYAHGDFENGVPGGFDLQRPLQVPGAISEWLGVEINEGFGWDRVRTIRPLTQTEGDNLPPFGDWAAFGFAAPSAPFTFRLIQDHYDSIKDNYAITAVFVIESEDGIAPESVYDLAVPNYVGANSTGARVAKNTAVGPIYLKDETRFNLYAEVWFHEPYTKAVDLTGTEVSPIKERIDLWATGGGGPTFVASLQDEQLPDGNQSPDFPSSVVEITEPPNYTDPRFTEVINPAGTEDGRRWFKKARVLIPEAVWTTSFGVIPEFEFYSGEALFGPYLQTDIGMSVARLRLVLERKE